MGHFSPFAEPTWQLLGFLALGLDGYGSCAITASKRGLAMKLNRRTVARGKDARELNDAYIRHLDDMQKALATLKEKLAKIEGTR